MHWQNGWIVFVDPNGNQDSGRRRSVLRVQPAFTRPDTFFATTARSAAITYNRMGYAPTGQPANITHQSARFDQHHRLDALPRQITPVGTLTTEKYGAGTAGMHLSVAIRPVRTLRERGFSLVEVMVALVICAVGLLGLAKMESLALSSTSVANSRSLAAIEASSLAAAMHANPGYWAAGKAPATTVVSAANQFFRRRDLLGRRRE